MVNEVPQSLNELEERVRQIESRISIFNERLLIISKNMVDEYRKLMKEVEMVHLEIKNSKEDSDKIKDVIKKIVREMDIFAKKEDIKVLEKKQNIYGLLQGLFQSI